MYIWSSVFKLSSDKICSKYFDFHITKSKGLKYEFGFTEKIPCVIVTRPEVPKLAPENTRNSQIAKLSPAESRLKHIDRHTKAMNSF